MRAEEFAALFEPHVKKSNGKWVVRCKAHDDGVKPDKWSLSIDDGLVGVVAKCFAGCSIEEICASVSVEVKDLFYESNAPEPVKAGGATIEKVYDYVDETGEPLFQSVRYRKPNGDKTFRQRHREGEKWVWDLNGARRVVYRLPDVIAAAKESRAVWIVEGEKDADALAELGFAATTNPMGASKDGGKWSDDYSASFDGCPWVLIACDCDEAGRGHSHAVAKSLHAAGVKCKVLDLAPARDDGYDVSDFLLEYGEEAEVRLRELARTTPVWPKNQPLRAPVVSAIDWADGVEEHDYSRDYLGAFFHGGERVHIIGPTGHGKTTFVLEALSCALRGEDFLGWQGMGEPVSACYINLEMPSESLKRELRDAGLLDRGIRERFFLWDAPEGLEIDRNAQHREMLADVFARHQIVALDPWFKLLADELSEGMRNVRPVAAFLDGMRKRHPETVIVIGFHSKEVEKGTKLGTASDAAGYKAFQRNADVIVTFQRIAGDRSRIVWAKTRDYERLPKIGDSWLVDWAPGQSFRRVERARATDELLSHVTDEWQSVYEIAENAGKSRSTVAGLLNMLAAEGRVEDNGGGTGRGHMKLWRLANADQERFDFEEAA